MHKVPANAPKAEQIPHTLNKFGDNRVDKYFWLKDRENAKVIDYLKAENAYTDEAMAPVRDLENKIFAEMKGRTKEDDASVPVKKKNYYYYSRFEKGQQYPIYARKKDSLSAPEEIILNVNEVAKGHPFCETSGPVLSPNQEIMAYGADFVGRRFYTIYFKNLKTGQLLEQKIENVRPNLAWAADNETLFYTQQHPETLRTDRVFRYSLKTRKSEQIYFEKDETFSVYLYQSLTRKYIYFASASTLTTEVHYLPSDQPHGHFKVFQPRERGHEYAVTDGEDAFYVTSNKKAKNYQLLKTDFQHTPESHWQEVIPYDPSVYLNDVTVFKNFVVLEERKDGLPRIHILAKDLKKNYLIPFADQSYLAGLGNNMEYDSDVVRYEYESMRLPESIYDFNMQTQTQELKKTKEVPHYDANLYAAERVFITVRDGTRVPVSLIMRKDVAHKKAPLLVYGYGSYGANMDPWYSQSIFSLVDRGFVYAKAHIRGGSEMGREWYDNGRTEHKKNTFYDFIDCTEGLIKSGYADPARVYAMGGSAGGLLMGAIANMRPDLYKGLVAQVPFVDVVTTMLDDSIPLTTGEYDEWGNPNEKKYYDYIKSYSPYDNVTAQAYPNMLITTGLHDSQVQYWEPAKWTAKLRELKTNDALILLKTDMEAGHGGASGRFDQLKEIATEFAFILLIDEKY